MTGRGGEQVAVLSFNGCPHSMRPPICPWPAFSCALQYHPNCQQAPVSPSPLSHTPTPPYPSPPYPHTHMCLCLQLLRPDHEAHQLLHQRADKGDQVLVHEVPVVHKSPHRAHSRKLRGRGGWNIGSCRPGKGCHPQEAAWLTNPCRFLPHSNRPNRSPACTYPHPPGPAPGSGRLPAGQTA